MTQNRIVHRPLRGDSEPTLVDDLLPHRPKLLSEVVNDSTTMTGVPAKDVFDANAAPADIADGVADVGTGSSGFARADHVHAHGVRGGGTLHAVAGASAGFMSAADKTALNALVAASAFKAIAGGGLYVNVTGTNPNTELGYGTWTAFGAGRVLVGLDAVDTEFDTAEETGGSKTHVLTANEVP